MKKINASIITIGDELLIGQTIDTNSAFIAQELNKIGVWVRRRIAVGDVYEDIWQALDEERKVSEIIILTGGLGPTADDITKPLLCNYFGGKLIVDENVLAHVKYLFEKIYRRNVPMLERNLKQAEVPDICTVLHNKRGTAPGMWFGSTSKLSKSKCIIISLPGVPYEMKGLMIDEVIPKLSEEFDFPAIVHRTVFTAGQGESTIAELLQEFECTLPSTIKLAYLPAFGMVKLRLTATGEEKTVVEKKITPYFEQLQKLVNDFLLAIEDISLEKIIGEILLTKNKTLGTAESCTGGYIAHLLTSMAGSSAYYKGSVVAYANETKENILDVKTETLKKYGAVSQETVIEMVKGCLNQLHVDFAIATSGIMGPGGGSDEKPVGTVWIAVGNKEKIETLQLHLRFDRLQNISTAAINALNFLRKFILANS